MVAKIITGKSISGAVRYNEQKVGAGKATLLDMKGFAKKGLSTAEKIRVFKDLQELNRRTKTNTVHISLNFSPKDKPDREKLLKIAADYMKGIGFEKQPYLLYRHFDAAHPHVHIVTTNIDENGKRIETHNLGRILSEKVRREIENRYQLIKAGEQKKEKIPLMRTLEQAHYGKTETKAAISNIVREVTRTYHFASLPELNAVLGLFHVNAYRGEPESDMHRNKGLVYNILDADGNRTGVPVKASSIYSGPTLARLEKQFNKGREERTPYRKDLKASILETMGNSTSRDDLVEKLKSKGIRPVFRINAEGRLYGVTYVDHATRSVFNGSALGKELSANALAARFSPHSAEPQNRENTSEKVLQLQVPESKITLNTFQGEDPTPYEFRQKKKRKRKKRHL